MMGGTLDAHLLEQYSALVPLLMFSLYIVIGFIFGFSLHRYLPRLRRFFSALLSAWRQSK